MSIKNQVWHSVKLVSPLSNLSVVRRWLVDNCGRRWTATNFRGQPLDWRSLGQLTRNKTGDMYAHLDYTTLIHFKHRDDMMFFLLVWPAEVLIKEQNERIINDEFDK